MIKTLRPYQHEALTKLRQRLKEVTHPLLVNASVGAGKSLILSELLLDIERSGWRALCLTMNSTLIEQNSETYRLQGGSPGIYCAALRSKDTHQPVIFASPHSIARSLPDIKFNLIIVDECHNINHHDNNTMYMRILNHYGFKAQEKNYKYRVVGLTGTPYRGKAESIIGNEQYFKEEVCSISTSWLISNGYLVPASFGHRAADNYDYSKLRVNSMGNFNEKELQDIIDKNERLTGEIMREVTSIVEKNHRGAFVFAATRRHCEECARSLPDGKWAIITGETPHEERKEILGKAREGHIAYLISVNCLNVGVDVPAFDVAAWLRPTESLVLYTQGIGRVLRLYPEKKNSLVLDYAGNVERHGDIDDPIINAALQPTDENEKEYVIPCYTCGTNNTIHARRCIGHVNDERCSHYFQFKECDKCQTQNDKTSRYCRECEAELIDPNTKLVKDNKTFELQVKSAHYWVTTLGENPSPVINIRYLTEYKDVFESFTTNTEKSKNITYAKFVRNHIKNPSQYYMGLHSLSRVKEMIFDTDVLTPNKIICIPDKYDRLQVIKKIFQSTG